MTPKKAERLSKNLKKKYVGKWLVDNLINNGKSAFVCKCKRKGKDYAIKIYDKELIEEVGEDDIIMRIQRQLEFKNRRHRNLVKVFDGGYCANTDNYYLVMEYLNQPNLADVISDIPRAKIIPVINQLISAVKYLEKYDTYHRDIKPDNISISRDFNRIILLDLGVIKPVDKRHLSSVQKKFLGTIQYSPKEYYLGEVENNDIVGWQAVTFYQIGAVLYDLIERKQLYQKYRNNLGKLSQAVLNEDPDFTATDIPNSLIHLSRKCLIKNAAERLTLVNWDDFNLHISNKDESVKILKKRINERILMKKKFSKASEEDKKTLVSEIEKFFENITPSVCKVNEDIPPYTITCINELNTLDFFISFIASSKFFINRPFTLRFHITIINFKNKMINIEISGAISNECPYLQAPSKYFPVYKGIFDEENLKKMFEKFFYLLYDKTLEKLETKSDKNVIELEMEEYQNEK